MPDITAPLSDSDSNPQMAGLISFLRRRPVLSAILIFLVDLLLSLLITQLLKPFIPPRVQADFFTLIVLSIVAGTALVALHWWQQVGFNSPAHWRNQALPVVPFLAVIVLPLVRGVQSLPLSTSLYYMVGYVLTAFHEEVVFRGLILGILGPAGRARAIWLSALLFGLAHGANLFVRSNPFLVLAQMVGAGTSGVGLAALRSRTNTIWFVMAIHFFEDFLLRYTRLPAIPVNVAQSVILFLLGLYILWTYRREERANN
jgi:uncharacterized protein